MSGFNRSNFLKERHIRAKQQRDFYEELTGQKGQYSDFLKTENPLLQRISVYEVSYQLSYSGASGSMFIKSPETFRVYALDGDMTSETIYHGTKDAVTNMKSSDGNEFQLGTKKMIDKNLNVDVSRLSPRGLEKSENKNISHEVIEKLKSGQGFYVESLDSSVKVEGGKARGDKGTRSAKMKTDLSLYIG